MSSDRQLHQHLDATIESALRRQAWLAEGSLAAFRFALECHGDKKVLTDKIQEIEELIADPDLRGGPMAPNAGPRIYSEGYLKGLRDSLAILSTGEHSMEH